MDTTAIGQFVAKFMGQLSEEWPEDCAILDVALVVDLKRESDGEEFFLTSCTETRWWVVQALLEEALDTLDAARIPVENDDE